MVNTRDFRDTVQARALSDPEFREGLLTESVEAMLSGDTATGKSLLRDYIKATIGFQELGALVNISPKNLMRMFSAKGNPTANKLFNIIHTLQQKEGVQFQVLALR
ncbi:MAG: DNA-binding phage protein [Candidatus Latescibacterota bacterium]|jgi:DNA-binding phage protein